MSQSEKLSKLKSLREMRERRCLGKIAQARTRNRHCVEALETAQAEHRNVVSLADARNRAVLADAKVHETPQTLFARLAMTRAQGASRIEASQRLIYARQSDVAQAEQAAQTAAAEHSDSRHDLKRITELLIEARRGPLRAAEQAEEDETSELFNASRSGGRGHV